MAIIQVAVPEIFIRALTTKYLWYADGPADDEWKRLVWSSRRGRDLEGDLKALSQVDLLIGHIASGAHVKFTKMPDWKGIKGQDLVMVEIDGVERESTQWVFHTVKAREGFVKNCKGKVWIHDLGKLKVPKQGGKGGS